MTLTFADTHNMIAYLTKSDASEWFDQIINFLNASSIKYALTVNPNIYVSCIKQFWTYVFVKNVNDVTRLQALVDKKKVIITEATIRDALRLDDAESIDCLPNEEIFTELSRMGLVRNVDSSTKFYMYPQFLQLMIRAQVDTPLFKGMIVVQQVDENAAKVNVDDVPAACVADEGDDSVNVNVVLTAVDEPSIPSPPPTTQPPLPSQDVPSTLQVQPTSPPSLIAQPPSPQQQPHFLQDAKISRDLFHTLMETCTTLTRRVEHLEQDNIAQALEITKLKQRVKKLDRGNKLKVSKLRRLKKVGSAQRVNTFDDTVMDDVSKQWRIIASMDADVDVTLKDVVDIAKEVVVDTEIKESDDKLEPTELQEVVEVVTTAKLMTEVVTAASATITVVDILIPAAIIAAAPTLTTTPSAARRRKGVVIRDPKETATPSIIIEQDEAFARELEAELIKTINWDDVIDQVQRKEKEDNAVMRYQALKRKPQTEAQARKNMMIYLRNMVGFNMDYFKGMKYDDIRLIFEKYFNSNVTFLEKTKEQMEEEDSRALKRISESQEDKAAKKKKLDEEVVKLKRHLQIVLNNEDDVYTEATPLARKVPVVHYEIYTENNKPYYKIIRADGSPQLFLNFLSLLRNFNREDLEVLWELVKEIFASSKPKNFSDDFLLTTLTYMFEKPDVQGQVWKNQRTVHGLAKVKSWRLLESCGVHIVTFTSTQMILLVERRYPLQEQSAAAGTRRRNISKCRANAPRYYMKEENKMGYQEKRLSLKAKMNKFIEESATRDKENTDLIKEVKANTQAAIRNNEASLKTMEIQIGQLA
nr:hypothetical protein [Tanacetum cinerariifolium]